MRYLSMKACQVLIHSLVFSHFGLLQQSLIWLTRMCYWKTTVGTELCVKIVTQSR